MCSMVTIFVYFVHINFGYLCFAVTENHFKWPSRQFLKIIKCFCIYRKIPSSRYQIDAIQQNIASKVQKIWLSTGNGICALFLKYSLPLANIDLSILKKAFQ